MPDEIDNAQSTTDLFTELALTNAKASNPAEYSGFCFNCREPIPKTRAFCDAECGEDFEKRRRMSL